MIGEDVEVVLLEKDGDSVKIGIHVPRSIRVFRKEIYEEIRLANQSALSITMPQLVNLQKLMQKKSDLGEK